MRKVTQGENRSAALESSFDDLSMTTFLRCGVSLFSFVVQKRIIILYREGLI